MCENKKRKYSAIHIHSDSSLLDGTSDVKKLIKRAKEFECDAIALNDHGNPSGLFTFYKEAKKAGVKPILGLEFYINNDLRSRVVNKERDLEDRDYHQSVYIKNKQGYLNFNYLTYISFTDGYYYKPRIDFDLLFDKKDGLMVTSSCMASKIGNYIRSNQYREAEDLFKRYTKAFGEDFYGEIQFNEVEGQKEINDFVLHMCRKYDIKTLIGGDVHYLNPEDNVLQDAIIRSKRDSETDWVINARHLFFHNASDYFELNKKFGFNYDDSILETALENSLAFTDKVNFEFETGKYHVPKINTGEMSSDNYLEKIVYEGAIKKIETRRKNGEEISNELIEEYEKRIKYELKVIKDLELSDYVLIVQDIINWEKQNGFYVGPGRGSVAGATISYFCGISDLCPIQHKLIFERFINPERKVMCVTENNFVLLRDGTEKLISEINLNDIPQTPDDSYLIQISERELNKNEKVFEIELEDGSKMELTEGHIIPVLRNGDEIRIRVDEVLETDELFIFKSSKTKNNIYFIPQQNKYVYL